ncbi:hypothetical protein ABTZ59_32385 [Streptomyces sp. NPDC094034]|uniref:hypothetical protein n=1 Tax=Streptomyces sp. NPDC094034 TaxID=3155309 RepID=UPI0033313DD4
MLSYLASSLPPGTSAQARLTALQCCLRAGPSGHVRLPAGLLHGMRLPRGHALWQELEDARWLRMESTGTFRHRSVRAQILDDLSTGVTRRERARAADWALRVTCLRHLRHSSAAGRLTVLTLTAHTSAGSPHGLADSGQLRRLCDLSAVQLAQALDLFTNSGLLTSWALDAVSEDLTWTLAQPVIGDPP